MVPAPERSLLDGRFALQRLVGSGGMGDVYRATDRLASADVAVKVLRSVEPAHVERFEREAKLLMQLRHPAVVRYVAHGFDAGGQPYLAMEWLEGETLAEQLQRGPLPVTETPVLAERVLDGLAAAHELGIVHRDIKPSNLLLVGGRCEEAKLLDFGIARLASAGYDATALTQTGAVLGTPAYMSPEQARGQTKLRPSTDLFSLGSVLYECLTGQRPFGGENALAVIAAICLEEPARPRSIRPEIAAEVDDLVLRLLAKNESSRPRDAAEAGRELLALASRQRPGSMPPTALALREMRVTTLVLIAGVDGAAVDQDTQDDTRERPTRDDGARLRAMLDPYGGRLENLLGGTLVALFSDAVAPMDLAARAGRFALATQAAFPGATVAICTGRLLPTERLSVGRLVDAMVPRLEAHASRVSIDPATADLLRSRFVLEDVPEGAVLVAERETGEAPRTVLGRPSPFVGRQRELDLLVSLFEEGRDEGFARAALVVAPPGTGKSRLCKEVLATFERRIGPHRVLVGRGDAMHEGASFGLVSSALRSTSGILGDDDAPTRRRKLSDTMQRRLGDASSRRAAPFLGEMAGIYFPDRDDPELQSARQDPRLMGERMRAAWLEWLLGELAAQPVVLVLEDLHWGDLPSVQLVDLALRDFADRPFFVLALARPEVTARFPRLWEDRRLEQVRLQPLTRKASGTLVRGLLGDGPDTDLVERLVGRAEGNPFFLEELVRVVDAGSADLPESVMGVVQSRLDLLGVEAGRVLRAASIFGESFAAEAVAALTGDEVARTVDRLGRLQDREALTLSPGTREYRFRHALMRETCYAALTVEDRALGHKLAGEWLEAHGETDAVNLAEHFDRGGVPEHAAALYARAARQALQGDDLDAATQRAARGVALGARGVIFAQLRLVQANVAGNMSDKEALATDAVRSAPPGTPTWYDALREIFERRGDQLKSRNEWADLAASVTPASGAESARVACLAWMAGGLIDEDATRASALLDLCERGVHLETLEPWALTRLHFAKAVYLSAVGSVSDAIASHRRAAELAEWCGDRVMVCHAKIELAAIWCETGWPDQALSLCLSVVEETNRATNPFLLILGHSSLGDVYCGVGQLDLARSHQLLAVERSEAIGATSTKGIALVGRSRIALAEGGFEEAARVAREAVEIFAKARVDLGWRSIAAAVLARALVGLGRTQEALTWTPQALESKSLQGPTSASLLNPIIRIACAEVFDAAGDRPRARRLIEEACDEATNRAARIADPEHRKRYLAKPENEKAFRLAKEWATAI
jgi:tetratricopeptide (TPR) repeat protein